MGKYVLLLNKNNIVIGKSICYIDLTDEELEITEEQYNQIAEFPLQLTIENGIVISWTKTELPYEEPQPHPPTEEEIAQQKLYTAIESATTIAGLKSALLGGIDKSKAKVKALK